MNSQKRGKKMVTRSSAKAKGRKLQKDVANAIKVTFSLEDTDVMSNPASCVGMDIILSNKAKIVFGYAIECKNQQNINIWSALKQAEDNAEGLEPLLVFKRNQTDTYACMKFNKFLNIVSEFNRLKRDEVIKDVVQG